MVTKKNKVRYINPPNILKQKVGLGGMPSERIELAEQYMASNDVDFGPYANTILRAINVILKQARHADINDVDFIESLTQQVMALKANGRMFRYALISEIAEVILNFLENIQELNEDALEIIEAHQNTLQIILAHDITGSGGQEGAVLSRELYDACKRYYQRYKIRA